MSLFRRKPKRFKYYDNDRSLGDSSEENQIKRRALKEMYQQFVGQRDPRSLSNDEMESAILQEGAGRFGEGFNFEMKIVRIDPKDPTKSFLDGMKDLDVFLENSRYHFVHDLISHMSTLDQFDKGQRRQMEALTKALMGAYGEGLLHDNHIAAAREMTARKDAEARERQRATGGVAYVRSAAPGSGRVPIAPVGYVPPEHSAQRQTLRRPGGRAGFAEIGLPPGTINGAGVDPATMSGGSGGWFQEQPMPYPGNVGFASPPPPPVQFRPARVGSGGPRQARENTFFDSHANIPAPAAGFPAPAVPNRQGDEGWPIPGSGFPPPSPSIQGNQPDRMDPEQRAVNRQTQSRRDILNRRPPRETYGI